MPGYSNDHPQNKRALKEQGSRPLHPDAGKPPPASGDATPEWEAAQVPASISDQAFDQFLDNLDDKTYQFLIECIVDAGYEVVDREEGK